MSNVVRKSSKKKKTVNEANDEAQHLKDDKKPSKEAPPTGDCSICCNAFTNARRFPVACMYCSYVCCVQCLQTYMLGSNADAHCMNCRGVFSKDFLLQHFSETFVHDRLSKHCTNVLVKLEQSLFPDTMLEIQNDLRNTNRNVLNDAVNDLIRSNEECNVLIDRLSLATKLIMPYDASSDHPQHKGSFEQFLRMTVANKDCCSALRNLERWFANTTLSRVWFVFCHPQLETKYPLAEAYVFKTLRAFVEARTSKLMAISHLDERITYMHFLSLGRSVSEFVESILVIISRWSNVPSSLACMVETLDFVDREKLMDKKLSFLSMPKFIELFQYFVKVSEEGVKHALSLMGEGDTFGERTTKSVRCNVEKCPGYMFSTQDKNMGLCKVCKTVQCTACYMKVETGTKHQCDPELVKTLKLIASTSKPCPNCKTRIEKISGCDQMFCTKCFTAFDWVTNQVIQGKSIHNPHYFDWLRTRTPDEQSLRHLRADVDTTVGACGENDEFRFSSVFFSRVFRVFRNMQNSSVKVVKDLPLFELESLIRFWNTMVHMNDNGLHNGVDAALMHANPFDRYKDIRKKFLLGSCKEEEWRSVLHSKRKAFERSLSHRQFYDAITLIASNIFASLMLDTSKVDHPHGSKEHHAAVKDLLIVAYKQVCELVPYFNSTSCKIAKECKASEYRKILLPHPAVDMIAFCREANGTFSMVKFNQTKHFLFDSAKVVDNDTNYDLSSFAYIQQQEVLHTTKCADENEEKNNVVENDNVELLSASLSALEVDYTADEQSLNLIVKRLMAVYSTLIQRCSKEAAFNFQHLTKTMTYRLSKRSSEISLLMYTGNLRMVTEEDLKLFAEVYSTLFREDWHYDLQARFNGMIQKAKKQKLRTTILMNMYIKIVSTVKDLCRCFFCYVYLALAELNWRARTELMLRVMFNKVDSKVSLQKFTRFFFPDNFTCVENMFLKAYKTGALTNTSKVLVPSVSTVEDQSVPVQEMIPSYYFIYMRCGFDQPNCFNEKYVDVFERNFEPTDVERVMKENGQLPSAVRPATVHINNTDGVAVKTWRTNNNKIITIDKITIACFYDASNTTHVRLIEEEGMRDYVESDEFKEMQKQTDKVRDHVPTKSSRNSTVCNGNLLEEQDIRTIIQNEKHRLKAAYSALTYFNPFVRCLPSFGFHSTHVIGGVTLQVPVWMEFMLDKRSSLLSSYVTVQGTREAYIERKTLPSFLLFHPGLSSFYIDGKLAYTKEMLVAPYALDEEELSTDLLKALEEKLYAYHTVWLSLFNSFNLAVAQNINDWLGDKCSVNQFCSLKVRRAFVKKMHAMFVSKKLLACSHDVTLMKELVVRCEQHDLKDIPEHQRLSRAYPYVYNLLACTYDDKTAHVLPYETYA